MQQSENQSVMAAEMEEKINIRDIIKHKKVVVNFQPIVSVNRKRICGMEGLIRGVDTQTNQIIPPMALFEAASETGTTIELDRLCREKVLEAFVHINELHKDKLLFLNIDASIIDKVGGSNFLMNQVNANKINPGNIVIELNETKVHNNVSLNNFVNKYRDYKFLIALDDIGTGFSNMDRILMLKPDIIKIDMSLIRNIHKDYYKQEVFKSLVNLSNKIGALIIAEGVEVEDEAIQVLKYGGHMIQGYYFSKPQEKFIEPNIVINDRIEKLTNNFKEYMNKSIREAVVKNKQFSGIFSRVLKRLVTEPSSNFDNSLMEFVNSNKTMECAYILDEKGIQTGDTIRCAESCEEQGNLIFYSASKGTDHSMKKYYYSLINGRLNKYITEPYISLATGRLCITFSKIFRTIEGKKYILCMDFENCIN